MNCGISFYTANACQPPNQPATLFFFIDRRTWVLTIANLGFVNTKTEGGALVGMLSAATLPPGPRRLPHHHGCKGARALRLSL